MIDRFLPWVGAGILAAGLLTATVAGPGVAIADDGTTSGSNAGASSEASNPAGKKQDSDKDTTKKVPKNDDAKATPAGDEPSAKPTGADDTSTPAKDRDATGEPAAQPSSTDEDAPKKGSDHEAAESAAHKTVDERDEPTAAGVDTKKAVAKAEANAAEDDVAKDAELPAQTEEATAPPANEGGPVEEAVVESTTKQAFVATTFAVAATKTTITPLTNVINAVGNVVFNGLALVTNLGAGPPVLPPGSTVTVSRSTLEVGGKTVTADWYFPNESEPPTGLIYFQHGSFAVGSMYSYTAAELAEETNSIVVAPTMSTNGFAPDGMWLGGAPLQTAVADLFVGDRAALTASASAAAGHTVTLPEHFVLAGHSVGGVFVTAVAGYLADDDTIADDDAIDDLEGVVLFDPTPSAGQDSVMPTALGKLPADLPVLLIGSPPSYWNELGSAANALVAARPGQFVGVILDGGSHADSLQGGNPLIQFIENVVSGVPKRENIAATQTLASGWINDMFHGTDDGIYASPGDVFTIDTSAGTATAYALPDTHHQASPFQVLLTALVDFLSAGLGSQG